MGMCPGWAAPVAWGLHLSRMRVMMGADERKSKVRTQCRIQIQRGMADSERGESKSGKGSFRREVHGRKGSRTTT